VVEEINISKIAVSKISFDDTNPNILTKEQMKSLKLVMEKFGFLAPVILNKDLQVIDGEHRVRVYQELGKKTIPAYVIDVNTINKKMLRQLMNKLRGEHDKQKDAEEFKLIFEAGKLNEFSNLLAAQTEDFQSILERKFDIAFERAEEQEVPEPPVTPKSKLGDVYQLGRHTLICGDNLDVEIPPKIDLILTDPPYNIGFNYNVIDDKKSNNDYADFIKNWINRYHESKIIVTPGPKNLKIWHDVIIPNDVGVWLKRNSRSGASAFHFRRCEPILFYGKFDKRTDDVFDYTMENYSELSDIEYQKGVGESHAPAKPLKFWRELINCYTNEGDVILDTFMGTGTTLITCEQTNRICYGMELDPAYIDVIITRWENYTGKKAKKV
jgi:DNA modification methylase